MTAVMTVKLKAKHNSSRSRWYEMQRISQTYFDGNPNPQLIMMPKVWGIAGKSTTKKRKTNNNNTKCRNKWNTRMLYFINFNIVKICRLFVTDWLTVLLFWDGSLFWTYCRFAILKVWKIPTMLSFGNQLPLFEVGVRWQWMLMSSILSLKGRLDSWLPQ